MLSYMWVSLKLTNKHPKYKLEYLGLLLWKMADKSLDTEDLFTGWLISNWGVKEPGKNQESFHLSVVTG